MNFFTKLFKKKQTVREAIDHVELGGEKSKKALKDAEDEYEKIKPEASGSYCTLFNIYGSKKNLK